MGDRANIRIEEEGHTLYFYTHWSGTELPETLAAALDRGRGRWTDSAYLNRIIFNEMTRGSEFEDTGFGISGVRCDWNHEDIIIDHDSQTVCDREGVRRTFAAYVEKYARAVRA